MRSAAGLLNIGALACVQVSNALVPILVFPYALMVLGAKPFATVVLAEAISNIVLTFVLYSFEIDGVARVSNIDRVTGHAEIGHVYGEILYTRLMIWGVMSAGALSFVGIFTGEWPVIMALWLLVPLGHILHSFWLYQATENNIPAAVFSLLGRVSSVVVIFTTLHTFKAPQLVPLAIGGCFALSGLASTIYTIRFRGFRPGVPHVRRIWKSLLDGRAIFLGNVSVILYRGSNVLILGLAGVGSHAIAIYSLAEKLTLMLQASSRPLTQYLFPRMIRRLSGEAGPSLRVARMIVDYVTPQILVVSAGMIAAGAMAWLVWDHLPILKDLPDRELIAGLFAIMAPSTIFGIANFMFGSAGLNYLHSRLHLMGATMATGVANLAICFLLARAIGPAGSAIAFTFSEMFLLALILARYARPGPSADSTVEV